VRLTVRMKRVVEEQALGFVATVSSDGTPNLSPKGTTSVWDDEHLVFLHLCSPNAVANLARNPGVEINVVDPILRKGYRFKGTGRVLTEGVEFENVCHFFEARRGTRRERVKAAVLVKVESAAPLVSPAYDDGTPEDVIVSRWARHTTPASMARLASARSPPRTVWCPRRRPARSRSAPRGSPRIRRCDPPGKA
jgi:predicted pyridoxine 5'-phosphate oxidase superfamily flavin-nucleotide-binding protein